MNAKTDAAEKKNKKKSARFDRADPSRKFVDCSFKGSIYSVHP